MDVLLHGGGDDLRGGEPDALVDHFETGVPGPHGDLLGTVGMPVQAGLADEELQPAPELLAGRHDPFPDVGELPAARMHRRSGGHPGRSPVLAEHLPQGTGPLTGGDAHAGAGERGRHQVRVGLRRVPQALEGIVHDARVTAGPPCLDVGAGGLLHGRIHRLDRRRQVGEQRVRLGGGEGVHAHHHVLARFDAHPAGRMRTDEFGLHVAAFDRGNRATHGLHPVDLGLGGLGEVGHPALHDDGALEEVGVLQQVGFVGEDLLDAQGPLLVPGPGQAERLVPGR